ncbi:hypothetical protein [Phenylobacterium immobile]|uniref:hypothetical protein n=1 Tax=Phenylobacterium immobile TaxID=21 RepID=UPI000AF84763|nr:hypothetical protein [Phenylobacterium immobile]
MQTRSDNIGETESTFAPVPTWERSAKRNKSLFGARKPAATHTPSAVEAPLSESSLSESSLSVEPRSFAPAATKTIVTEPTYRSVTPRTVTSIDESPAPVVDARD